MSTILDEPEQNEKDKGSPTLDTSTRNAILGGVGLIVIAIGWSALGLAYDEVFIEPPILFLAGVFLIVKNLATGISGKK